MARTKKDFFVDEEENTVENTGNKKYGVNGNLIPVSERSKNEQRRIQSNGGKKSGETRRKKKELRELASSFLLQDAVEPLKGNLRKLGFDADDMTNLAALMARVYSKAVNEGDLNASRTLVEWAGFSPMLQMQENEMRARLEMMQPTNVSDNSDTDGLVQIYLPAIDSEDVVEVIDDDT